MSKAEEEILQNFKRKLEKLRGILPMGSHYFDEYYDNPKNKQLDFDRINVWIKNSDAHALWLIMARCNEVLAKHNKETTA